MKITDIKTSKRRRRFLLSGVYGALFIVFGWHAIANAESAHTLGAFAYAVCAVGFAMMAVGSLVSARAQRA